MKRKYNVWFLKILSKILGTDDIIELVDMEMNKLGHTKITSRITDLDKNKVILIEITKDCKELSCK